MKKNILTMAVLLMASAAVFTACSSDDNITGEQPANPTGKYTMTVQASKGGDATTRALSLGRNGDDTKNVLNATWDANEVVLVYQGGSQIGTLYSAASTTNETTLTGTLDSAPDAGQNLTLYFHTNATSYAGQDGTLATIASTYDFCAPATITAGSFTVSGSTVSTNSSASFGANQQAIVKFTLKDKGNGDAAISATKLVINDGTTDYTINPTPATSEIYAAIPGFTSQTVTLTATVGSDTYTYEKTGVTFENGQYYEISVKMTKQASAPEGAISGKFSVSANKQVYFSKGNLQATWDGTLWNWHFAENQWDYIGNAEGNTKVSASTPFVSGYSGSSTTVDLFGWVGTSGTWTDVAQYGITSSTAQNSYGNNDSEALKSDWGNTIGSGWRTLSKDEWTYLFNTRTVNGGSGKSYTLGQRVNDKLGVVIYPDDYTGSEYAGSDWSTFEAAGCVFLPLAGYRSGTTVSSAGSDGYYRSSSPNYTHSAYVVSIYWNSLNPAGSGSRYYGESVRLVRDVE